MFEQKRLMVYLDGSEESYIAAQYAIYLANIDKAELIGVYVIKSKAVDELLKRKIFLPSEKNEYLSDLEHDANKYLLEFERMAKEKHVMVQTQKISGGVQQAMNALIQQQKITHLIVGDLPKARSRQDDLFSETEHLIRLVPCSVLIVKDSQRVENLYDNL
jgi:nucleotide-binding universal stress UspA family protein